MDLQQVQQIIVQGEGLRIEYKEASDAVPASFYETVVSFSEYRWWGCSAWCSRYFLVTGINKTMTVKLQKDIVTALNTKESVLIRLFLYSTFIIEHPDVIMVIQVPSSSPTS